MAALHRSYNEARSAFVRAKGAYVKLQGAHAGGRFHDSEAADFRHYVDAFRDKAGELHHAVQVVRTYYHPKR